MKQPLKVLAIAIGLTFFVTENAQAQKDKADRPSNPAQISETIGAAKITIDYSQPSKNGREIFGKLVPYGKVWRTGANEATWIELSADVTVEGQTLKKGKYGIFTIPGESEWTIIFNSKWDQWGNYSYNEKEDVLRVKAKTGVAPASEKFTIVVNTSGTVSLMWDKTKAEFTIKG